MALSNTFREPRREIIETAVGAALMFSFIAADYQFARWLETLCGNDSGGAARIPWPVGLIGGVGGALAILLLAVLTHQIGESVCDSLQDHGLRLRPRKRYN